MSKQLNHKARLSRAMRNNLPLESAFSLFRKSKFITIAMLVVTPFYPTLASLGVDSVARGYYDESSIILVEEDDSENIESTIAATGLVSLDAPEKMKSDDEDQEEPEFVPAATPPEKPAQSNSQETLKDEENKEPAPKTPTDTKLQVYTVKEYDSIDKIAEKYKIDMNVILWQNNIKLSDTLTVGQKIKIPAKSGIIFTIKKGNTLSEIAKVYKVSMQEIMSANGIKDATKIRIGQKILLPGVKPYEPPKPQTPQKTTYKSQTSKTVKSQYVKPNEQTSGVATFNPSTGLKSSYRIKFTGKGRGMAWGNCTWYVARNKTVTWRGNAKQWMRNARAQGKKTGRIPVVGAIIQFSGHGYHPRYGHVGIVREVHSSYMIISDMNYAGLNKITWRKISRNDPAIDGYIYVD